MSPLSFLQLILLLFLFKITVKNANKCHIETGLFSSPGAQLFNTNYGSGNVSLFYKMYIPSNIDTTADNYDNTMNTPTVLLVHGSGPQNHDEQIPVDGTPGFWPFRDIAKNLCKSYGIIVFTYDKRSCSPGSTVSCNENLPPWCVFYPDEVPCFDYRNITYFDFVADAISAVNYIQTFYSFINPNNIIPTGHSQGGTIVPMVASYTNLSTVISLMGIGIPIDDVVIYQETALGYPQSVIDHDILQFKLIKNGSVTGWQPVSILNSSTSAIFWKQWIDSGMNKTRIKHIRQLNNILTINSDTDFNVPPFAYIPLHDIINDVSANVTISLYASMNVFPNMIHQMVYIDDYVEIKFNVSDDVIDLIGNWVNGVYENDDFDTDNDRDDASSNSADDMVIGVFIGIVSIIFCGVIIGFILVKLCGYKLCKRERQGSYTAF